MMEIAENPMKSRQKKYIIAMRKFLPLAISLITLCVICGCNSKNVQSTEESVSGGIKEDSTIEMANDGVSINQDVVLERAGIEVEDVDDFIEFFTDVYNGREYEEEKFIKKYCTEKLQKKLQDAYEFAGEEGYDPWYATEKFRSDAQDGPTEEYKLVKIVPEGNGWYKYDYIDMGNRGSHRIKVITHINPRDQIEFCIDELE